MESQETKQVQRLLQQVLGEESNNRKTLTQKHIFFTPMNSLHRGTLQWHRPFANAMYVQTPLAFLIQVNVMAEQNIDINTQLSTCCVTKRENTKSYRILGAIKSPICYFFEIRETQ